MTAVDHRGAMFGRFLCFCVAVALCILTAGREVAMASEQIGPRLYFSRADIDRAKQNIKRYAWARQIFEQIKSEADKWSSMSEAELRALVPPPNAIYAYGFSSCPECHSSWPWWGADGVCDFSRPGTAKCPSCQRVFPDGSHPDDGTGWVGPDGKRYYFVGVYNSYAIRMVTLSILSALTNAYVLTGEDRYANAAIILMEEIAKAYPASTIGSIDYPNAPGGRFERTQYQVARVLVHLAQYYDILREKLGPECSFVHNVLRNGADYCYSELSTGRYGLTNGAADFLRGILVVGLALDDPEYIEYCLSGPYSVFNFLENNLDRDGQYYETSMGYSQHALSLYIDMAEMLANYHSDKYPAGIDLYAHPKLSRAIAWGEWDMLCAGHSPRFGDWSPDWEKIDKEPPVSWTTYMGAERLYRWAPDEESKRRWASMLNDLSGGDVDSVRSSMPTVAKMWLLFHAEPIPASAKSKTKLVRKSALLDGKGIAILRADDGVNGRAVLIRYGPSVCHGHRDDLNINFYALGRELTYDLGYVLGSAHVQRGWANQTASHNLVVVNEQPQMLAGPSGGSVHLFGETPVVKMVEASSEASYKSEGVSLYSRTLAMVESEPGCSYLVDVFRVKGGNTHDLFWHSCAEKLTVEGVELGEVQPRGSLAGVEYDWGRRVGPDGGVVGEPDKPPYWNPPPGNGYGFLYDIRRGQIKDNAIATWVIDSKEGEVLRIFLSPPGGSELITATAPGILPSYPKPLYAIVRRSGSDLDSAFASVLQPYRGINPVKAVERMTARKGEDLQVGLRVDLKTGCHDYILSATDPREECEFECSGQTAKMKGQFAFLRVAQGAVREVVLLGGTLVCLGDTTIATEKAGYWGRIASVDYQTCKVTTGRELPLDGSLNGQYVYFSRRDYSHKSCYRIRSVAREKGHYVIELDTQTLVLGKGLVSSEQEPGMHEVRNVIPLEKSTSCCATDTGYFRGKLLRAQDGTCAPIINVLASGGKKTILVPDASIFKKGQPLTIYDIQAGDTFEIPTFVHLSRSGNTVKIQSTTRGRVDIAGISHDVATGLTKISR